MFFKKLLVILYKNLLLRQSQWLITSLEVILPILFVYFACLPFPIPLCKPGQGKIEDIGYFELRGSDWCVRNAISYSPTNKATQYAADRLNQNCGGLLKMTPYGNESELLQSLIRGDAKIGLVFPDGLKPLLGEIGTGNVKNSVISYKIRIHPETSKLPSTERVLPIQQLGDDDYSRLGPNYFHGFNYLDSNFSRLQLALDKILVEMITGQNYRFDIGLEGFANYIPPRLELRSGPSNCNGNTCKPREPNKHKGIRSIGGLTIPLLLSLSVLFMVPTITRNVVSEKQTGIAELLKSAGVSGLIQWLGWMINSVVPMLFSLTICTVILFSEIGSKKDGCEPEALLLYSDGTLIWSIFILYILSTIAFCFFICSLIKKRT